PAFARNGAYLADLALPALSPGQVYWVQPTLVNAAGSQRWGEAVAVPFQPALVLDRKPASLQFKAPAGPTERTLRLKSSSTLTIFKGKESVAVGDKMDGFVLERLDRD